MDRPPDLGARTGPSTGRRNLRPAWRPGESGNPRGGAVVLLNLATRIRRDSDDGQEILDFYFAVLRGEPISVPGRRTPMLPTLSDRTRAAEWLVDRGWGRARETLELQGDAPLNRLEIIRHLQDDERQLLRGLLATALRRSLQETATVVHEAAPPVPLDPPPAAG